MSLIRIPLPSDDSKSIADTLRANLPRIKAELGPDAAFHGIMWETLPGQADGAPPVRRLVAEVRGQPSQASRQRRKAGPEAYDPIQFTLDSVQTFGFTHPSDGRYLMVPEEFQAILLRETKAVAAVVWEIMQQTIGWEGNGLGRRREWAPLTKRHFVRARILSRSQAELGIKQALDKGYIKRRPLRVPGKIVFMPSTA
jgi:hypothetical protein